LQYGLIANEITFPTHFLEFIFARDVSGRHSCERTVSFYLAECSTVRVIPTLILFYWCFKSKNSGLFRGNFIRGTCD